MLLRCTPAIAAVRIITGLANAYGCGFYYYSKADDILNPILRERVRTLKETERGREEVCKIMENRITEEKIELAKNAIKSGELTLEQIAKVLDLSLPIVEELARAQAVGA